jgi:hypothetical protein
VIALTARLSQAWEGPYVTAAASRPRLLLAGLIGLHVLCWTLLPLLTHPNAPLDVVEGAAWGRAWQWGYHKGPPLFAWIMGALDPLPGPLRLAAVYLVSQLAIALTFFGVWQLGVRVFSRVEALLGVMLLEGVYYFTFPTPELNEIVLQMPVSALLGWIFHRAMSEERTADWIAVGALAALGMYTRYSTAMLLLALGCFLLLTPARRCLRRAGPYLALAIFLLLWSPHLLWIYRSDFQSIAYVAGRAVRLASPLDFAAAPARFALAQLAALLPAVILAVILRASRRRAHLILARTIGASDRLYIAFIALGPFLLAELVSTGAGLGMRAMWGGPLWCFIGLFLVMLARPPRAPAQLRVFAAAWVLVCALPLVAYAGVHGIGPMLKENEKRSSFPGDALAHSIAATWRDATGQPLRFVVGDMWLAGTVAFYAPDRPSVFSDADPAANPWIDPVALAVAGAVLVWDANASDDAIPAALQQKFPAAIGQTAVVLAKLSSRARKPVRIGWALLPPAALAAAR